MEEKAICLKKVNISKLSQQSYIFHIFQLPVDLQSSDLVSALKILRFLRTEAFDLQAQLF
jgi:hypothetical protein